MLRFVGPRVTAALDVTLSSTDDDLDDEEDAFFEEESVFRE